MERGHEVGHHSYSHRSPVDLSPAEERGGLRASARRARAAGREAGGPSRRALGGELADAPPGRGVRPELRLEPDGLRPALPAEGRRRDDRRASAPLEPGRLGAVRVPAAPRHRQRHRVARQGARAVAGGARRDAPPRLPLHAHLPSVPVRAPGASRGAARAHRVRPRGRRRGVRHRRGGRRAGDGRPRAAASGRWPRWRSIPRSTRRTDARQAKPRVVPPLGCRICPTNAPAASVARKVASAAISSGRPMRPIGLSAA